MLMRFFMVPGSENHHFDEFLRFYLEKSLEKSEKYKNRKKSKKNPKSSPYQKSLKKAISDAQNWFFNIFSKNRKIIVRLFVYLIICFTKNISNYRKP